MSSVTKLKINGTLCEEESMISNYVANFYEKLYSRQTLDEKQMDAYYQNINQNIKKLTTNLRTCVTKKSLIMKYLKLQTH